MKELFERITVWREKNLPAGLLYNPLTEIGFLIEELGEVNKEFIKGDIDAAVGEICDLIIYAVNAIELLCINHDIDLMKVEYTMLYSKPEKIIETLHENILFVMQTVNSFDMVDSYKLLIDSCWSCIFVLGYSPEIALEETVKKIESRRGGWDTNIGKWVKEKNQADAYVPDYSIARLS